MAAIPGWAYILLGVFISIFSKIVESKSTPGTFKLFFWIGIVFVVIGIGKLVFKSKKEQNTLGMSSTDPLLNTPPLDQPLTPQNTSRQYPAYAQQAQHLQTHRQFRQSADFSQGQHQVHRAIQQQHPSVIACPACGTMHYDYANFCMRCGSRIK
jgi:zinc-ribbon domain